MMYVWIVGQCDLHPTLFRTSSERIMMQNDDAFVVPCSDQLPEPFDAGVQVCTFGI